MRQLLNGYRRIPISTRIGIGVRFVSVAVSVSVFAFSCTKHGPRPEAQPASVTGVTVRLPLTAMIRSLDPVQADDVFTAEEVGRAYESLLQYHYLKRPYVLQPNLAESMPEISADGTTYTFRLKKGILFQDDPCFTGAEGRGREVVADDIIYSLKRVADPKYGAPA